MKMSVATRKRSSWKGRRQTLLEWDHLLALKKRIMGTTDRRRTHYLQGRHTLVEHRQRSLRRAWQKEVETEGGKFYCESNSSRHDWYLHQKQKRGQVVQINKELRISHKRPSVKTVTMPDILETSTDFFTWMWRLHRLLLQASRWRGFLKSPLLSSCSWASAGVPGGRWPPSRCLPRCAPGRPPLHPGTSIQGRAGPRWAVGPGSSWARAWWCWEGSMERQDSCKLK